MVEEGILDGGPKGGGKKSQEMKSESHLIPSVSGRPRYDKTTQLHQNSREKKKWGFMSFGMKEMGGLYSSGGRNMNGRPFNEG